jgi:hypothetical protein
LCSSSSIFYAFLTVFFIQVLRIAEELFSAAAAVKHQTSLPLPPEGPQVLSAKIITRESLRSKAVTVQRLEEAWSFFHLLPLTCYTVTRKRSMRGKEESKEL